MSDFVQKPIFQKIHLRHVTLGVLSISIQIAISNDLMRLEKFHKCLKCKKFNYMLLPNFRNLGIILDYFSIESFIISFSHSSSGIQELGFVPWVLNKARASSYFSSILT